MVNLLGLAIPTVVHLITVPLYLRWVGELRYGVLLLAMTMLGYFYAFDFGLGRAVAHRIASREDAAGCNRTFWAALLLSAVMGVAGAGVLYLLGHWLFGFIFQIPEELRGETEAAVSWLAAIVPLVAMSSVLAGTLQARHAFVSLNAGQIVGMLGVQILPLASAALGHGGIPTLVAAALGGRLLGATVLFWLAAYRLPIRGRLEAPWSEALPLLRFGGWVSGSTAIMPLLTIVDRLVIGAKRGAAAVTCYSIPFNVTQRLTYLPFSLSTTLFPRFSEVDGEESRTLMDQSIIALTALQTPLLVVTILFIHPFFDVWIGRELAAEAAPVAIILLVGVWINGPSYVPYTYLPARGRPDLMTKFYLAELLPFLAMLWILVGALGVIGAAIAWSVRSTADALFCFIVTGTTSVYLRAIGPTLPVVALAVALALGFVGFDLLQLCVSVALTTLSVVVSYRMLPLTLRTKVVAWWQHIGGRFPGTA